MTNFLDFQILDEFHATFDETVVFSQDEKYKYEEFNLFCAISHRITTCIQYLNEHSSYPKTEEDFINFLTYSDMIIEGIRTILKTLNIENPFDDGNNVNSYKYFKDALIDIPKKEEGKIHARDTKFFRYVRALALAHSFGTNQHKGFLLDGEVQYSPFVLANNQGTFFENIDSPVGVMVYSNKKEDQFNILFSFEKLKEFINSRYELLALATNKIKDIIHSQETEWKKRKVNRSLSTIEILEDIQNILEERHEEDRVKNIIMFLSCDLSKESNRQSVEVFRKALSINIPTLCDAIDDMDYEKANGIIKIAYSRPKNTYDGFSYQMEKIFDYLRDTSGEDNIQWGLKQAEFFAQEFAKKWVSIDTKTMSVDEIKLLVRTACYLEWKAQGEKNDIL